MKLLPRDLQILSRAELVPIERAERIVDPSTCYDNTIAHLYSVTALLQLEREVLVVCNSGISFTTFDRRRIKSSHALHIIIAGRVR